MKIVFRSRLFLDEAPSLENPEFTQVNEELEMTQATKYKKKLRRKKDYFRLYGQVNKRIRWMPWR